MFSTYSNIRPTTRLPLDLIRRIVDYTASTGDAKTIHSLVLVSRQFKEWVDEKLYAKVELHFESQIASFANTIENPIMHTSDFFTQSIHSLSVSFDHGSGHVPRILLACRSVESFTMYIVRTSFHKTTPLIDQNISHLEYSLHHLRPRRVQTQLYHCFRDPLSRFSHSLFEYTTHLAILDDWEYWTRWSDDFSRLPALTHLSLDLRVGANGLSQGDGWRISDCVWRILNTCKGLDVCIIRLLFDSSPDLTRNMVLRMMHEKGMSDARLVFLRETTIFGDSMARSFKDGSLWSFGEKVVSEQLRKSSLQLDSIRRCDLPRHLASRAMGKAISWNGRANF
ncbi:hypothetical protein D9758_008954 [Tetrapyrgos nigripes]|uniref:Uncharacterized protein n=1 Tax=Tetrapyrgos nigripes TaxID=182062 RepID=A0A8H5LR96_9AGAR|nr:hypothetical protein D9758_008954 [Tetrapyrgos nigripes]